MILDGLMTHQQLGVPWLIQKPRAMLAWEMGVGKTATATRAWENTAEQGPALVLCLASARENWRREVVRFAIDPEFPPRVQVITRTDTPVDPAADVVVTNYDKLLNRNVIRALRGRAHAAGKWGALILDEAHVLKSPGAARTKLVYGGGHAMQTPLIGLAERVWALTGTPMPNHPAELWTHAYHLWPEAIVYRDKRPMELWEFELGFCQIVQGEHGYKVVGGKNLAELKQRLSPYLHRLKRKDVLDLPPCRIDTWPLDLENGGGVFIPHLPELLASLSKRFGSLQDVEQFDSATIDAYLACINSALSPLATLRRETATLKAVATSLLVSEELEQGGPKTVIFAHHREAIEILAKGLKAYEPAIVHGDIAAGGQRDAQIDRFNNDPKCRVFIGQLQAAGSSINLQAASNVVFVEASWTPGENEQALSRVYRHGQKTPVLVRFTYLKGSIDEAINRAIARKVAMITQVID